MQIELSDVQRERVACVVEDAIHAAGEHLIWLADHPNEAERAQQMLETEQIIQIDQSILELLK